MPTRHTRFAPVYEYTPQHINALAAVVPVGSCVSTTSATTITAGTQTVTPASMANITPGMLLNFANGTGTAEVVTVQLVTATTFTATFVNGHSGAYTITSLRGISLGTLVVGNAGSAVTLTLYNGSPNLQPNPGTVIGVITPVAGATYIFNCNAQLGLFYTLAGTTAGDYTLMYLDNGL